MRTQSRSHEQDGNVIVVVLCVAAVIGFALASSLALVRNQTVAVARSQSWNSSLALAEAGIEDGLGLLNKYAGTHTDPSTWATTAWADNWTAAGNVYHVRRYIGSDYYDVYVTNVNNRPLIKSIGTKKWNLPDGGPSNVIRSVLVETVPASLYQGGILAKHGVSVGGNVLIDSFNSQDTNYSTGGRYNPAKRSDSGNVATTESNVVASVTIGGSVLIYGKLYTGPGTDTYRLNGNASVGSTNWVPTSGIQTNWARNDLNIVIPDAPPPIGGYAIPAKTNNTVNGTNYPNSILLDDNDYTDATGNPGGVSLTSSDSIIVRGNVNVYLPNGLSMSGHSFIYITTNSSLTIFSGGDVSLAGGGVMNGTGCATNLTLYGTSTCTSISYSGGSDYVGTVYAPYAEFKMTGGGNTIYNLVGSVVADSITVQGKYQIHYDESLEQPPAGASYYVSSWQEVSP